MNKTTTVKVTQDALAPVPVEILAESIVAISQGVKKIMAGPLNETAIVLLITNATPMIGSSFRKKSVPSGTVRAVLEGMQSLEREYLKPKKASTA